MTESVPAADPPEEHETPGGNPVNEPEQPQPEPTPEPPAE